MLVVLTRWRCKPMYAAMYPDGYTHPNRFVPGAIVGNCISLMLDLIGFSFGLPVLLTLYREPTLYRALKEAPTVDDMPLAVFLDGKMP